MPAKIQRNEAEATSALNAPTHGCDRSASDMKTTITSGIWVLYRDSSSLTSTGAYCARHWPLNIPHMDDNNNNKRSDLQNNSTAESVKRLLGILRQQSELEKSENGICSGLPKPLSTAASESDPSVELVNFWLV
ncbi:unnamed protein product [Toxocara canis]|uniref:Uncharacterized protein n=1 Tax=Toxocara canis TaxID=6265 RepID=A0A183U6C2_TOXCA|nr:unnamed protein product [Toxocara canis]